MEKFCCAQVWVKFKELRDFKAIKCELQIIVDWLRARPEHMSLDLLVVTDFLWEEMSAMILIIETENVLSLYVLRIYHPFDRLAVGFPVQAN